MTAVAIALAACALAAVAAVAPRPRLGRRLSRLRPASGGPYRTVWPRGRASRVVAAGAAGTVGGAILGPAGALGAGGAVWFGWRVTNRLRAGRVTGRIGAQLPEALELMGGAIRAGASIRQALSAGAVVGGPLGSLLARAGGAAELGRPIDAVLADLARHEHVLRSPCAALRVGLSAGGDAARALDRLAAAMRARMRLERELRALSAQVRLSAAVLAALPVGTLVLFLLVGGPSHRDFLREPAGQACLIFGITLDAAGFAVLRRMARVEGLR